MSTAPVYWLGFQPPSRASESHSNPADGGDVGGSGATEKPVLRRSVRLQARLMRQHNPAEASGTGKSKSNPMSKPEAKTEWLEHTIEPGKEDAMESPSAAVPASRPESADSRNSHRCTANDQHPWWAYGPRKTAADIISEGRDRLGLREGHISTSETERELGLESKQAT